MMIDLSCMCRHISMRRTEHKHHLVHRRLLRPCPVYDIYICRSITSLMVVHSTGGYVVVTRSHDPPGCPPTPPNHTIPHPTTADQSAHPPTHRPPNPPPTSAAAPSSAPSRSAAAGTGTRARRPHTPRPQPPPPRSGPAAARRRRWAWLARPLPPVLLELD